MVEGFNVTFVFFVFECFCLGECVVRRKSRFGWGIWLNDGDIGVERLTIRDAQVKFSVDFVKWFGFNSSGGCSIAGVAIECLNHKVVAKQSLSTSSIGTAHWMNVEVDWNGCSAEGTVARRWNTRDGEAKVTIFFC